LHRILDEFTQVLDNQVNHYLGYFVYHDCRNGIPD
jgi:hypothetical protein